jgi:hypothetical protein
MTASCQDRDIPIDARPILNLYRASRCVLAERAGNTEHIRDLRVAMTGLCASKGTSELNLNLMVSADCKPTSASRIRHSTESSTMDCHESKLNGTFFSKPDWPDSLRVHAAIYREIAERTDDPFIKNELLDLASICEEAASNIEDHLTRH